MNSKKNKIFAILLIIAIPVILAALMLSRGAETQTPENQGKVLAKITSGDITKGNREATVELIEYSDFQCPACGAYYPHVKRILEKYGDKMVFAYRHFPLNQHRNAPLAARAAEAAGKQDKFWEMHNLIFESQGSWSNNSEAGNMFVGFAERLGLDIEKFNNDIDSRDIWNKVADDLRGGISLGVNSTPTFFLNGKKLNPNTLTPQALRDQVNALVQEQ